MHKNDGLKGWRGTTFKMLATMGLLALVVMSGCAADLRSDALITEGLTDLRAQKGRALLKTVETRYGKDSWSTQETTELVFRDDWDSALALLLGLQPWDREDLVQMRFQTGTFDIRADLIDGPRKGETMGLEAGQTYKAQREEAVAFDDDGDTRFILSAISYLYELPMRIQKAPIVLYDGQRSFDGQDYDLIFATWNATEPNAADQYVLWINQKTGLIDYADHTVREQGSFFESRTVYRDLRRIDGVLCPHEMTITDLGKTGRDEGYVHQVKIEKVRFNSFPVSELHPTNGIVLAGSNN